MTTRSLPIRFACFAVRLFIQPQVLRIPGVVTRSLRVDKVSARGCSFFRIVLLLATMLSCPEPFALQTGIVVHVHKDAGFVAMFKLIQTCWLHQR